MQGSCSDNGKEKDPRHTISKVFAESCLMRAGSEPLGFVLVVTARRGGRFIDGCAESTISGATARVVKGSVECVSRELRAEERNSMHARARASPSSHRAAFLCLPRATARDDSWLEEFAEAVSGMVARHRNRTATADRERAEGALRMQRRFLAAMSHELRRAVLSRALLQLTLLSSVLVGLDPGTLLLSSAALR